MKKFKSRTLQFQNIKITVSLEPDYWDKLDRYFAKGVRGRLSGREGHALLKDKPLEVNITTWLRGKADDKHTEALRLAAELHAREAKKTPEQKRLEELEKIAHWFAKSSDLRLTNREIESALNEMFGVDKKQKAEFLMLCESTYQAQQDRERREWNDLLGSLAEVVYEPSALPYFVLDQINEVKRILSI